MQSYQIGPNEAGQRFDKFLHKYMPQAGTSFFYKMLRKKNITLNGKKAEGKEILSVGDKVCFFFSDETFLKFRGISSEHTGQSFEALSEFKKAYQQLRGIQIIYEDADVLILNKPAGILSQKAKQDDLSLNEWLIGYLLTEGKLNETQLSTFKPSICNRLDRNTSGLVLAGKSLKGSQELSRLIREREVGKFYRTFVKGQMKKGAHITGFLHKDEKTNRVTVSESGGDPIETAYAPLAVYGDMTYLEVELLTGKTHQIRAHLSSVGHPILGDTKYGNKIFNEKAGNEFGVKWQLLHAYRIEFPFMDGALETLSGKVFTAPLPAVYEKILQKRG